MKNLFIKSIGILTFLVTMNGCLDMDELRKNPNNPNSVPPSLLFTSVAPRAASSFSSTYTPSQYHVWLATDNASSPKYDYGRTGFSYGTLRNIDKMVEEAKKANAPIYTILAKFLRAKTYIEMSRIFGDIPFSEAMKGDKIPKPKYDTQKSVYIQCLNLLDNANKELGKYIKDNPGKKIDGDYFYGGNLKKWQKLINSYTLRVLISLSRKVADGDVDAKGRFAKIIGNPSTYPLMSSSADNAQIAHKDEDGFRGSYNPNSAVSRSSVIYTSTYIDLLKKYKDPRLRVVADPNDEFVNIKDDKGKLIRTVTGAELETVKADFKSYVGADFSASPTGNSAKKLKGKFCRPNKDRYWNFAGQPSIFLGYVEQEFNIAEAAHRGWITADAKVHYEKAVKASMDFYGIAGKADAYLKADGVYETGQAGLTKLLEQKYLAFAENSGWESFFNQRRTGVPVFKFSEENNKVTKLPIRWGYPLSEDNDNKVNYRAALKRQFGVEEDTRDLVMWLLKK